MSLERRNELGQQAPMPLDLATGLTVCALVAEDPRKIQTVLREAKKTDDWLPSYPTWKRWLASEGPDAKKLNAAWVATLEDKADLLAGDTIEIADGFYRPPFFDQLTAKEQADFIARLAEPRFAKLMCDARQWMAGKLNPRKYGEAKRVELSGAVPPKDPRDMSDAELLAAIQEDDGGDGAAAAPEGTD